MLLRTGSWRVVSGGFSLVLLLPLAAGCQRGPAADLVLTHGHIVTLDSVHPGAEALAVRDGRIVAVGTSEEIDRRYPRALHRVDLEGKTLMPGLIDAHGHLFSLGRSLMRLNLRGLATPEQVVERVRARAEDTPPGEWITGWGWDEGAWATHYPDNGGLDRAAPENPVFLEGLHGFAGWANTRALTEAGITAETPDPPDGRILRDPTTGAPSGVLLNDAQSLVTRHIPPPGPPMMERAIQLAAQECLKNGLTTVHDANANSAMLDAMQALARKGELGIRVYVMLDSSDGDLVNRYFDRGPVTDDHDQLTVRAVKVFADGALGSRGAALFEPYSDDAGNRGRLRVTEDSLYRLTVRALRAGFQVATHAIGDRANHIALDAYERALRDVPSARDPRLRIEHAQVLRRDDVPRFARLGVIASMQPTHATSDMPWAEERLGPTRVRFAYAWRSVLETGAHLPLSSDFPGETLNPFYGMYAAETRRTPQGEPPGGWFPEQRLTRREAMRGYTREAAYAGFEERSRARIAPGLLADFIVLSDDIRTISPERLLSVRVLQTYVGGRKLYDAATAGVD